MTDLLPLLLWIFAIVWMLAVCGITIVRCRFRTGERHPQVELVSWTMVEAQMASVLLAGVPFITYLLVEDELSPMFRRWYAGMIWPGCCIAIALVFAELAFMYVQARRAQFTLTDRVLRGVSRREGSKME